MTTRTKPPPAAGVVQLPLRRFTVAEYYAMAEAGILTEDDRVELIDGVIVEMAPVGSRHVGVVNGFNRAFTEAVGRRAVVQVQSPIRLDDGTEPQPDLALLHERADLYASGHAGPRDVLLLIEVADSSVGYDRNEKLPRYARAGIPEVWLAILPEDVVEVNTEPTGDGYRATRRLRAGEVLRPACFDDVEMPVDARMPAGLSDAEAEYAQAPSEEDQS